MTSPGRPTGYALVHIGVLRGLSKALEAPGKLHAQGAAPGVIANSVGGAKEIVDGILAEEERVQEIKRAARRRVACA